MIERQVTFHVLTGKESDFIQLFTEAYRPAMSMMAGFKNVSLLRDQEEPSQFCMEICFDSVENAAAWRASPEHEELKPKLSRLYKESTLKVFEVIA